MIDITAAAIASVISSAVATTVAFRINKGNQKKSLDDQLDNILKISIQYPYLESSVFTATWNENKNSEDEKYIRYELYCTLVFNFMERLCKFYKFNHKKLSAHINLRDWIRIHKDSWLYPSDPVEHTDGYHPAFRKLIDHYLKDSQ
jgi:hypothetical protein